jgi:hypothetical protein
LLEAALARGGRSLAPVIARAAELGCKLDGWDEHFRFAAWQQAFADNNLSMEEEAARAYASDAPLPWDHLDSGVSKAFLLREYRRSLAGEVSRDCRESCLGCGMTLLLEGTGNKGACQDANLDTV